MAARQSKKRIGRPSTYTPALAAAICAEVAGGKSMREICRAEKMPDMSTVFRWLGVHAEFREQYAKAREAQADYLAEELLEIADDGTNDWMTRLDGGETVNTEAIGRSRLRVDTRKWLLAKLQPKKYGDRIAQEITGKDGGPIETRDMSLFELARRIVASRAEGESA